MSSFLLPTASFLFEALPSKKPQIQDNVWPLSGIAVKIPAFADLIFNVAINLRTSCPWPSR